MQVMTNKKVKKIEATKPTLSAQYSTFTRKRKVAAYARVSTAKEEQENSFDAQVSYYTQKIQANPEWVFVEVYSDEGITGTNTKKRDGFNRMIEDALAGKIDLILTKSVSRFARNTVDSLVTIRQLKEKGVEVFFEKENIYTLDAKGELLLTIMSSLAQEEARSISENTSWGRRKSFADGKVSLGYSNFLGYDKGPDGELVINEEQAKIVRRIYAEFLAGKTPGGIAKGLTADGIETPGHKTVWQASTVLNILKNEKYYGAAILQKQITVSYLTKEKRPNTGELPTPHKQASNDRYPFTGKLFCGVCGKPYCYYHYTTTNKQPLAAYRCMSRKTQSAVEVPGQTYTPPHKATFNLNASPELIAYRERYCKPPKERPMLCTDVRIPTDLPQKAFCRAWNLIVAKKLRYQATLRSTVDNAEDILVRYRAEEMCLLIDEIGKINEFSNPLMLKTLDRVVVNTNGKLSFIFQSGIKITV